MLLLIFLTRLFLLIFLTSLLIVMLMMMMMLQYRNNEGSNNDRTTCAFYVALHPPDRTTCAFYAAVHPPLRSWLPRSSFFCKRDAEGRVQLPILPCTGWPAAATAKPNLYHSTTAGQRPPMHVRLASCRLKTSPATTSYLLQGQWPQ